MIRRTICRVLGGPDRARKALKTECSLHTELYTHLLFYVILNKVYYVAHADLRLEIALPQPPKSAEISVMHCHTRVSQKITQKVEIKFTTW